MWVRALSLKIDCICEWSVTIVVFLCLYYRTMSLCWLDCCV